MFNKINLSSRELHKAGYKNIKNILDFLKSNNKILTSEIVLELDKINESISFILSNSDVKKPDFGKINKNLEKSKLKTEITCDFISKIEKILKKELISFKQEDIDELDLQIKNCTELLDGISIIEKAKNVELIREKRELESKRNKIKQLQEQIANIELVRNTYLEELEKSKNKEDGSIPKQDEIETIINLKEEKLAKVVEVKAEKIDKEIDEDKFYKTFYSKDIESIKEFHKTCKVNQKSTYFIEFINKIFSNKGSVYLKLQIINFLIDENLDKNYIKKELFIGLASQVDIRKDKEYTYFEQISKLIFPERKSIKEDISDINLLDKSIVEKNKTIKIKKKKIKEPEINNLFNDYHIVFVYLQNLLDNEFYGDFIKFITKGKNDEILINNSNFRQDIYDLLIKNKIKIESIYNIALKLSNHWRSNQILGMIRKVCSITGDFSFIIKDFWNLHIVSQSIIIITLLNSNYYLEYKDLLIDFYPELIKLDSSYKIEKLISLYEEKGLIKEITKIITENIEDEELEQNTNEAVDILIELEKDIILKKEETKELLLEEKYFNIGLDKQFNNILEEKNIEKLYAFVVLYNSKNLLIDRKINELFLFGLTKKEKESNSKIITKILTILNK